MLARLWRDDTPIHITIANLLAYAIAFLTIPLVARAIGPTGRGETAAALSAFAIAPTIIGLGLPLELRRRSATALDRPSVRAARDLVLLSTIPAAVLGLIFVATAYASVSPTLRWLAFVGIVAASVGVSWAADTGVLMGQGRYRAVFLIRVAQPTITLVIVGVTAATHTLTAPVVLAASIAGTLATGLLALTLCRVSFRGSRAPHKTLLRSSARFAGSVIAESASSRLDQVVVLPLIGATAAGYYSIAASVSLLPLALGQSLAADHFRAVAACTKPDEILRLSSVAIKESLAVAIPACLVFGALAAPALPWVFGADFAQAVPVFLVLIPGSICLTAGFVASMLLAAQGRGKTMTLLQVGGLALGMLLLFVLGPIWSAMGAAVASSASYLALFIGQILALRLTPRLILPTPRAFRSGMKSLMPERSSAA